MTKIFGANWKTSVTQIGVALSSVLTVLAALPYQLGDVATIVPPAWKSKIVTAGIVATFILRVLNGLQQKDKNVTGGTLQQTADGQVADPALLGGVSKSVADTQKAIPKA